MNEHVDTFLEVQRLHAENATIEALRAENARLRERVKTLVGACRDALSPVSHFANENDWCGRSDCLKEWQEIEIQLDAALGAATEEAC